MFLIGCLAALLCGLTFSNTLHAGDIAVQFADVVLEDLEPGGVYNLRALRGLSYMVMSNYEGMKDIEVVVEKPDRAECEKGYEPTPEPTFLKCVKETYEC